MPEEDDIEMRILQGLATALSPQSLADSLCRAWSERLTGRDVALVWKNPRGQAQRLGGQTCHPLSAQLFVSPPPGCTLYQDHEQVLGLLMVAVSDDRPAGPQPLLELLAQILLRAQHNAHWQGQHQKLVRLQQDFNDLLLDIRLLFHTATSEHRAAESLCKRLAQNQEVDLVWIENMTADGTPSLFACVGERHWLDTPAAMHAHQTLQDLWQQPQIYLHASSDHADDHDREDLHLSAAIPLWQDDKLWALLAFASPYRAQDLYNTPIIKQMLAQMAEELTRSFASLQSRLQAERTARIQQILLEHTDVGITLVKDRRYIEVNHRFAQMLGYQHPDEIKQQSTRIIYPHELEYNRVGAIYRAAREHKHGQCIAQVAHRDGHVLTCQVSFGILYDQGEEISVWTLIDISDTLARTRERDLYRERLEKLADRVPGMLCQFRTHRQQEEHPEFVFLRGAIGSILQLSPDDDLHHLDAFEQILVEDREPLRQALCTHSQSHQALQHEFRIHTQKGEQRWLQIIASPESEDDVTTLWHGFISDTSEAHLMRDRLHESATQIRAIFHASPTALSVSDLDTFTFVRVNLAWQRLFGYEEAEARDKTTRELGLWGEGHDGASLREQLRRDGHAHLEAAPMRDSQGHALTCRLTGTVIRSAHQDLVIVAVEDMTVFFRMEKELRRLNEVLTSRVQQRTEELATSVRDLQSAQNQLLQSEKLSDLGARVGSIAHDINTQIGNARFAASSLLSSLHQLDIQIAQGLKRSDFNDFVMQTRNISEVIMRTMESAADLVQHFHEMAVDRSSNRRRVFDLREHVAGILLMLKPRIQHSGCSVYNEVAEQIHLDSLPGALEHTLTNLITNALHHAFDAPSQGHIWIRAERQGHAVEISVSDDGRGMSESVLQRIFEPFFTTRAQQGGSGLGLPICVNAAQTMGGELTVESTLGHGTTFRLHLPLQAPTPPDQA